jgi:hypothetical protein
MVAVSIGERFFARLSMRSIRRKHLIQGIRFGGLILNMRSLGMCSFAMRSFVMSSVVVFALPSIFLFFSFVRYFLYILYISYSRHCQRYLLQQQDIM